MKKYVIMERFWFGLSICTSKWLLACNDHSSLVENIRPHSSHDQDNCWWLCGIFKVAIDEPPEWCDACKWLLGMCECDTLRLASNIVAFWPRDVLLFSLFSSFFFISVIVWLSRLPNGAMFVGVTCLNLFIWITNLSRRANALLQTWIWTYTWLNNYFINNGQQHLITSQTYGFSPVCIRMWIVNLSLRASPFPHTVHSNALCVAANGTYSLWIFSIFLFDHIHYILFEGVVLRIPCDACWTCWRAFNRLAGCIEPPST